MIGKADGRFGSATVRFPEFLIVTRIGVYTHTRKDRGDEPLPSWSIRIADAVRRESDGATQSLPHLSLKTS
jgi:hypothetical protein